MRQQISPLIDNKLVRPVIDALIYNYYLELEFNAIRPRKTYSSVSIIVERMYSDTSVVRRFDKSVLSTYIARSFNRYE